jgi:nucleoside-diphosphate-sugar epimerase
VKVTITGGLGFLGRLVSARLADAGHEVSIFDVATVAAAGSAVGPGARVCAGEITDPDAVAAALPPGTEGVVHLASMVSAECELAPERAMTVNVGGLGVVLSAARRLSPPPRFVFASSIAVFGDLDGNPASDRMKHAPLTTYGVTKAIGELLVNEHTRRGWVDGRIARLPTVVIRPGRPNAAASSFASGLFREPLAGEDTVVPVEPSTPIVVTGHRAAADGVVKLLTIADPSMLGPDRGVNVPGLETTAADMIATSRRRPEATGTISVAADPLVQSVVGSWPGRWDASRALALGLPAPRSLDEIVDDYLADFAAR